MRDLDDRYEMDHLAFHAGGPMPPLPPVSHLELGRQEALIPARQPAFANTCLAPAEPPEPVTLESLARAMEKLIAEVGPLPPPFPLYEPLKVDTCLAMRVGL